MSKLYKNSDIKRLNIYSQHKKRTLSIAFSFWIELKFSVEQRKLTNTFTFDQKKINFICSHFFKSESKRNRKFTAMLDTRILEYHCHH